MKCKHLTLAPKQGLTHFGIGFGGGLLFATCLAASPPPPPLSTPTLAEIAYGEWFNFFCGLPRLSTFFLMLLVIQVVGIHVIDAPILHPMSEGLFNFVIGWTFMFAPLLFTDCKRYRYKGSLDILWGFQMFLTNTFLIPYMAIRLNDADADYIPRKPSQLASVMTNGAPVVGLIGGAVCLISALWALYGRMDGDFGSITDRLEYLVGYLGSERLAYAFIWDIFLYIIFQPWLIGDNLQNIQKNKVGLLNYLRFVPVVGLIAYLLSLDNDQEL